MDVVSRFHSEVDRLVKISAAFVQFLAFVRFSDSVTWLINPAVRISASTLLQYTSICKSSFVPSVTWKEFQTITPSWQTRKQKVGRYVLVFRRQIHLPDSERCFVVSTGRRNILFWLVKVSKETGSATDDIQEEASAILEEMAQCLQLSTVRFFAFTLSKVFKTLFRSICVNEEGIQRVRVHTC